MTKKTTSKVLQWLGVGALALVVLVGVRWVRMDSAQDTRGIAWQPFSMEAFEAADRPIVLDVYADWCVPCVELEHSTFKHPDVVALMPQVLPMRIDATDQETLPEAFADFLGEYDVFGLPTILFFDRNGKELRELRLLGFESGREFAQRIRQILG